MPRSLLIYLWRDIFKPHMLPWVVREFGGQKPLQHRRDSISPCLAISPLVCPSVLALLIILPEATGVFSFFLSLYSSSSFSRLYGSSFFLNFFFYCFSFSSNSHSLCLFFFLKFSFLFLDSVFNPDGLCNCLRLSFQPGWVMYL